MFRRFSLFDTSPPAASVSISRPKIVPPLLHSKSLNSSGVASLVNGNGYSEQTNTQQILVPRRTSPIAIRNDRKVLVSPQAIPSTPSPKESKQKNQRHSTGSAPNPSLLQQQVHAAQVYLSSNRNSFVLHPHGSANAAREHYRSTRSISSPASPSPLSSSFPSTADSNYHPGRSPSWYTRFSQSLRKSLYRQPASSVNNNVICQYLFLNCPYPHHPKTQFDSRSTNLLCPCLEWHRMPLPTCHGVLEHLPHHPSTVSERSIFHTNRTIYFPSTRFSSP